MSNSFLFHIRIRCPKAIRTRLPTRFPIRFWMPFWWDKSARVAAETLVNTGLVVLAGEITTHANIDYIQIARDTVKRIGYDSSDIGFRLQTCAVLVLRQAIAGHRPGRGRGKGPGPGHGRWRPGSDVRLRLQ